VRFCVEAKYVLRGGRCRHVVCGQQPVVMPPRSDLTVISAWLCNVLPGRTGTACEGQPWTAGARGFVRIAPYATTVRPIRPAPAHSNTIKRVLIGLNCLTASWQESLPTASLTDGNAAPGQTVQSPPHEG